MVSREQIRLDEVNEGGRPWRQWGPYLSERQWGTVREDYSKDGNAWDYFSHDQSRSRAYRWGEDGIAGISDDQQCLCFAIGFWNFKDPILKERLFGLANSEGNHGEDVKEFYFYLDSTPTHSYMKYLYKYPQNAYPYDDLVRTNCHRSRSEFEYELVDTNVFAESRYFDVQVEYAKADVKDILINITVSNRGPNSASMLLIPTLWFRNTWSDGQNEKPRLERLRGAASGILARQKELGAEANRPVFGGNALFNKDPYWRDLIPFYEYFHGDNGSGIGASHQTGWTGLAARLLQLEGAVDRAAVLSAKGLGAVTLKRAKVEQKELKTA
jgi:hypothetical protein